MENYLLLSGSKRKNESLHYIDKSVLNGLYCYEILLDKINKTETLVSQFKCGIENIITKPDLILMHVSVFNMKNTINIYDPYNYKNL
jgi:hypothetical protein